MGLSARLTDAWARRARWLWLLRPFSALYGAATALNRALYQRGLRSVYYAPVPVVVVGNVVAGGTGKSPLVAALYRTLTQDYGLRVGVISRGYGGAGPFPQRVTLEGDVRQVGDEPLMLAQQGVPVVVGPNRRQSIECWLAHEPVDLILTDDGLQHHALDYDAAWVVEDAVRGQGTGWLLPAGPLREQPRDDRRHVTIYNGGDPLDQPAFQLMPQALVPLQPAQTLALPQAGDTVHAVAGIGNPTRFFDTLRQLGFIVVEHPFDDHQDYDQTMLPAGLIITTEKDAVKLRALGIDGFVLPVRAHLNAAARTKLAEQVQALVHRP